MRTARDRCRDLCTPYFRREPLTRATAAIGQHDLPLLAERHRVLRRKVALGVDEAARVDVVAVFGALKEQAPSRSLDGSARTTIGSSRS